MPSLPQPRLRVAICGGGVGGLTCALALSQYHDIHIELYEAAREFAELGAGVGIWPRPWTVMQRLGIDSDLLQTTDLRPKQGPVKVFGYRKSDQAVGFPFYTLIAGGSLLTFHRPDFQRVLLKHLPRTCSKYTSKLLRSYSSASPTGPITLLFEDGTSATCDVLIGADGIKSSVRRFLLRSVAKRAHDAGRVPESDAIMSCIDPVWSGTNAYRAIIPAEKLKARSPTHPVLTGPMQYLGKDGYVIAYPISAGRLINFVAFDSKHDLEGTIYPEKWVGPAEKAEFFGRFEAWEVPVKELLDCVEAPLRWAVHVVKPLGTFVDGRAVLIGDAAHAMHPHQGAGAGSAIEDAYILASLLGHPKTTRQTVSRTLEVYDSVRRPFAHSVGRRSKYAGQLFTFYPQALSSIPNIRQSFPSATESSIDGLTGEALVRKLTELGDIVTKNWEWSWSQDIDKDVDEAVKVLVQSPGDYVPFP